MKSLIAVSLTLGIGTATSPAALAQDAPPMDGPGLDGEDASPMELPGMDIGLRVGFADPFGNQMGGYGNAMKDGLSGAIPLGLEVGYRINAYVTLGALFQYEFGLTKNCPGCSSKVIRLGIEGLFRLSVGGPFVPWLGFGTGYEWLSFDASSDALGGSVGYHGFELVTVQAGGDFRISPHFTLGPFLSLSVARYDTITGDVSGLSESADIPDKTIHEWLQFGIKGTFNIAPGEKYGTSSL